MAENNNQALNEALADNPAVDPAVDIVRATGKRKNAIASVWLRAVIKPDTGRITVNKKEADEYFPLQSSISKIMEPIKISDKIGRYDIKCHVKGGGKSGQAGALQHAISKALVISDPDLRRILRRAGFLTRDARIVERKKYGRHKARKSHQFSKR